MRWLTATHQKLSKYIYARETFVDIVSGPVLSGTAHTRLCMVGHLLMRGTIFIAKWL